MDNTPPSPHAHRQTPGNRTAVVFLHGFGGDYLTTWLQFPSLLCLDPRLHGWDVFTLGYASKVLRLDVAGVWSADPEIRNIAGLFGAYAANSLRDYQSLALISHSMGGLAVQRALIDDASLRARVSHVLLYGTPSNGLAKATWLYFWKRQIKDMAVGSDFISGLRRAWSQQFGTTPPFQFLAVAGDQDEFVPRTSSIDLFEPRQQAVVPGNHVEMVKPQHLEDLTVQVAANFLAGAAAPAGPWSSDRVAIESRDFQHAIDHLLPHPEQLDEAAFVQLALALESVGRQSEAIALLEGRRRRGETDAMGVLAGRLKRRWIAERNEDDARRALELYTTAFSQVDGATSEQPEAHAQAFYHGINIAFLELTYHNSREAAKRFARRVLDHCEQAPCDKWNLAAEAEAWLHLNEDDAAVARYHEAVRAIPTPSQLGSMYRQAIVVCRHLGKEAVEKQLERLFRSGEL